MGLEEGPAPARTVPSDTSGSGANGDLTLLRRAAGEMKERLTGGSGVFKIQYKFQI
jgi:hypothetical protein